MNCPICGNKMDFEKSDFVLTNSTTPGLGRMMPQTHYRCDYCDVEYVRTGYAKMRKLDGRD